VPSSSYCEIVPCDVGRNTPEALLRRRRQVVRKGFGCTLVLLALIPSAYARLALELPPEKRDGC
jgi:hypothetical protein